MTTLTRKVQQPLVFKEVQLMICDGCGKEVDIGVGIGDRIGWVSQMAYEEEPKGSKNFRLRQISDFCTDCRPKIERAQKQELDAIKAETFAAKVDVAGVG